jgi:hypothetical protein
MIYCYTYYSKELKTVRTIVLDFGFPSATALSFCVNLITVHKQQGQPREIFLLIFLCTVFLSYMMIMIISFAILLTFKN